MIRTGCDLSVLLSTKTSTSGRPSPRHRSYEIQTKTERFKLFPGMNEPRLSDDSFPFLMLDEFDTPPLTEFAGNPEAIKK
jgi:hypothetical protein